MQKGRNGQEILQEQLQQVLKEVKELSEKYSENYCFQKDSHLISPSHLKSHNNLRMPCQQGLKTKPPACACAKKRSDKGGWLGSE